MNIFIIDCCPARLSVESQKGINAVQICSRYVPLRTRRVLLLYKVYGDSAFLVLNWTSLNSVTTLLALSWRYVYSCLHPTDTVDVVFKGKYLLLDNMFLLGETFTKKWKKDSICRKPEMCTTFLFFPPFKFRISRNNSVFINYFFLFNLHLNVIIMCLFYLWMDCSKKKYILKKNFIWRIETALLILAHE